jgi:hypothetical protein
VDVDFPKINSASGPKRRGLSYNARQLIWTLGKLAAIAMCPALP